jgi:hypothetical protein
MYKIQLDKASDFECKIKISGASVKKTKVNLVAESEDYSLKFKGTINEDGKITVPISKLKGVLEEGKKGNLYLEVIADDTYFTPYETQYETEVSRKVEVVSINGKDKQSLVESEEIAPKKPIVTISEVKQDNTKLVLEHTKNIVKTVTNKKLNFFKHTDSKEVVKVIKSYLTENKVNDTLNKDIMANIYNVISKVK